MMTAELRRRLALAAPVVQLAVGSALLALAMRPAELLAPAVALVLLAPGIIGLWVFRGRIALHRVLLAAWAPAGVLVLFFVILLALRFLSGGSNAFFWVVAAGPLLVLFALGGWQLRGASRSTWLSGLALWVLAIAEAAVAVPLSARSGSVGDMQSLAGTLLLLFGPGVALGAWGGLALAARIPESPVAERTGVASESTPSGDMAEQGAS